MNYDEYEIWIKSSRAFDTLDDLMQESEFLDWKIEHMKVQKQEVDFQINMILEDGPCR